MSSTGNCDRTVAKTSGIGNSHRQKTCQIAARRFGMTVVKTSGLGNSDRSIIKLTKSPSFVSNTSQNFMNTQLYHFLLPLPSVLFLTYFLSFVFPFSFFPFNKILANYDVLKSKNKQPSHYCPPPIIYPPNGVKYHVLCTWGPSMQVTWSLLI